MGKTTIHGLFSILGGSSHLVSGISRVNPLITGVITHLLSGMSHQVSPIKKKKQSRQETPNSVGGWDNLWYCWWWLKDGESNNCWWWYMDIYGRCTSIYIYIWCIYIYIWCIYIYIYIVCIYMCIYCIYIYILYTVYTQSFKSTGLLSTLSQRTWFT